VRRLVAASTLIALAAAAVAAAATGARPPKTIASYCSPSGDVCLGVLARGDRALFLELATPARRFGRYRLCVRLPGGGAARALRCGSFPVSQGPWGWHSSVTYAKQFPLVGPGTYRVTWKLGSKPLGPTLRFRLPLAG
jgi:hypothetical protein